MKLHAPDVANTALSSKEEGIVLQRVGMNEIEMPVLVGNPLREVAAKIKAYVSLDDVNAKGIHMSRLYLALKEQFSSQALDAKLIRAVLEQFQGSHSDVSASAHVEIRFELPATRKALISGYEGYRSYPVGYRASLENGEMFLEQNLRVTYSSTCPCSAALSRQLIQKAASKKFENKDSVGVEELIEWLGQEEALAATPHGQRSYADISVVYKDMDHTASFLELVDISEDALKTPVQAAVKRPDEQEFARLNATNLMFAEDAARKLARAFNEDARIADYRAKVSHIESLHPHDAVAIVTKGLKTSRLSIGW